MDQINGKPTEYPPGSPNAPSNSFKFCCGLSCGRIFNSPDDVDLHLDPLNWNGFCPVLQSYHSSLACQLFQNLQYAFPSAQYPARRALQRSVVHSMTVYAARVLRMRSQVPCLIISETICNTVMQRSTRSSQSKNSMNQELDKLSLFMEAVGAEKLLNVEMRPMIDAIGRMHHEMDILEPACFWLVQQMMGAEHVLMMVPGDEECCLVVIWMKEERMICWDPRVAGKKSLAQATRVLTFVEKMMSYLASLRSVKLWSGFASWWSKTKSTMHLSMAGPKRAFRSANVPLSETLQKLAPSAKSELAPSLFSDLIVLGFLYRCVMRMPTFAQPSTQPTTVFVPQYFVDAGRDLTAILNSGVIENAGSSLDWSSPSRKTFLLSLVSWATTPSTSRSLFMIFLTNSSVPSYNVPPFGNSLPGISQKRKAEFLEDEEDETHLGKKERTHLARLARHRDANGLNGQHKKSRWKKKRKRIVLYKEKRRLKNLRNQERTAILELPQNLSSGSSKTVSKELEQQAEALIPNCSASETDIDEDLPGKLVICESPERLPVCDSPEYGLGVSLKGSVLEESDIVPTMRIIGGREVASLENVELLAEDAQLMCLECERYVCGSFSNMQDHIREHLEIRPFKCWDCNQYFSCSRTFRAHLDVMDLMNFCCLTCGFSCNPAAEMQDHLKNSHLEQPLRTNDEILLAMSGYEAELDVKTWEMHIGVVTMEFKTESE